ncbi:MAG: hypothetical protein J6Y62_06050 [Clostridia bacterium]|nr:hypothetical protein [Clostridia bacterium]
MDKKTKERLENELTGFMEAFEAGRNQMVSPFRFGDLELWLVAKNWNQGLKYYFAHQGECVDNMPITAKARGGEEIKVPYPYLHLLYDLEFENLTLKQRLVKGLTDKAESMERVFQRRHSFMERLGFGTLRKYRDYMLQMEGPYFCEARFTRSLYDEKGHDLGLFFQRFGKKQDKEDFFEYNMFCLERLEWKEDRFFKILKMALDHYGREFLPAMPEGWRMGVVETEAEVKGGEQWPM